MTDSVNIHVVDGMYCQPIDCHPYARGLIDARNLARTHGHGQIAETLELWITNALEDPALVDRWISSRARPGLTSLDTVMKELGVTQADLDAIPDDDET